MRIHKEHLVNKERKQKKSFACSSQHCYFENFELAMLLRCLHKRVSMLVGFGGSGSVLHKWMSFL
jgi:hypothetical protein